MTVRGVRSRRRAVVVRAVGAAGAVAIVTLAAAPGAAAADLWWVTNFHLAENHEIATGAGVTVAVLDGQFSTAAPSVQGIDLVPPAAPKCTGGDQAVTEGPAADHGTQMVTVLAGQGVDGALGVAPKATVLAYSIGLTEANDASRFACTDASGQSIVDTVVAAAINDAVDKGARIISMSFGSTGLSFTTQTAIAFAERKGVVFVASTDDFTATQGTRVIPPAVYNGVVAVNGIDQNSQLFVPSATGAEDGQLVAVTGPGKDMTVGGWSAPGQWDATMTTGGSSAAAAFVAGALATTLSKYPRATGNQLVQSLARNTGGDQHDPVLRGSDGYGWGTVSLTSMLQHDPTAYPDENPLLRANADPRTSDILPSASASASASSSPTASGSRAASSPAPVAAVDDGSSSSTGLFVGVGIGVVAVLLAVVALVVVLVRRGRRTQAPPPPPTWG